MDEKDIEKAPNKGEKAARGMPTALIDLIRGTAIGAAGIIPGFSGGSVAVILGIYEKLVSAVTGIFKSFKQSVLTLLPIILGIGIGMVALLFPIEASLAAFPLPTVSLFVGLALGGLPNITDKVRGRISFQNALAFFLPFAVAFVMIFLPISEEVDLSSINFGGFVLLFLAGILASSAMIIPGISGSMLLLIVGYYNPIVGLITNKILKGVEVWQSLGALLTFGVGIAVGFIIISIIMKVLLEKCNRGTYFAIIGFIIGSVPAIYASVIKDAEINLGEAIKSPVTVIVCAIMLTLGAGLSLLMVKFAKKD